MVTERIIKRIYDKLFLHELIIDAQDLSLNWAKRNKNWYSYLNYMNKDACIKSLLSIYQEIKRCRLDKKDSIFEDIESNTLDEVDALIEDTIQSQFGIHIKHDGT